MGRCGQRLLREVDELETLGSLKLSTWPPACLMPCRDLKGPNLLCDEHFRVKVSGAQAALPTLLVQLTRHLQKLLLLPVALICMLAAEVAGALATLPGNMPVCALTHPLLPFHPRPDFNLSKHLDRTRPASLAAHFPESAVAGQRGHAGEKKWKKSEVVVWALVQLCAGAGFRGHPLLTGMG